MHPTTTTPTPNTPDQTRQAQDTTYYRDVLHDIIGMAHHIARHVHDQATQPTPAPAEPPSATNPAPATTPTLPTPALALDRLAATFNGLARTIRRTILLAQRLHEPPRPHNTQKPQGAPPTLRALREPDIARLSDRELDNYPERLDHAESLDALDTPESLADEDDLAHLPLAHAIAHLRAELALHAELTLPPTPTPANPAPPAPAAPLPSELPPNTPPHHPHPPFLRQP